MNASSGSSGLNLIFAAQRVTNANKNSFKLFTSSVNYETSNTSKSSTIMQHFVVVGTKKFCVQFLLATFPLISSFFGARTTKPHKMIKKFKIIATRCGIEFMT